MDDEILELWFSDRARRLWWEKNDSFDAELRDRFGDLVEAALAGKCDDWARTPDGAVALVIVLDQLPRNIFRNTPEAFAGDEHARRIAADAISRGFDRQLSLEQRMFLYMPYQHSESLADQQRSLELFKAWASAHEGKAREDADNNLDYAQRHHDIIARFGRFPHRNAILGRESTADELTFLAGPGSSF